MSDAIFIPPDGALQVVPRRSKMCRHDKTKLLQCDPIALARLQAFWVGEKLSNHTGCACDFVYTILIDSLPAAIRAAARSSGRLLVACPGQVQVIE